MGERRTTTVCALDLESPRISAYDIHDYIYEQTRLVDNDISMVQIDLPKRHVYITFPDNRLQDSLHLTWGLVEYWHTNGEISIVRLETPRLGMRKVEIANLPLEVPDVVIRSVLSCYGEVKYVRAER